MGSSTGESEQNGGVSQARQLEADANALLAEHKRLVAANSLQEADQACSTAIRCYQKAQQLLMQLSDRDPHNIELRIEIGFSHCNLANALNVYRKGPRYRRDAKDEEERIAIAATYYQESEKYAVAEAQAIQGAIGFFEHLVRENAENPRSRRQLFQACMDMYRYLCDREEAIRRQALPLHWANSVVEQEIEPLPFECWTELAKALAAVADRLILYWTFDKGRGGLPYAQDPERERQEKRRDYEYLVELRKTAKGLMVRVVKERPTEQTFLDQLEFDLSQW